MDKIINIKKKVSNVSKLLNHGVQRNINLAVNSCYMFYLSLFQYNILTLCTWLLRQVWSNSGFHSCGRENVKNCRMSVNATNSLKSLISAESKSVQTVCSCMKLNVFYFYISMLSRKNKSNINYKSNISIDASLS